MNKIKIALLKNQLSRHLAAVRRGAEIVVMDRQTPVARLVPYGPHGPGESKARMAELVRQGTVHPGNPTALAAWVERHRPARLPARSPSVVQALIRARRESTR